MMDVLFSSSAGLVIDFLLRNNLLAANSAFRSFPKNRHEETETQLCIFLCPLFFVN